MSEELKLAQNISKWPEHKVNYWGITKCGNTSIKWSLLGETKLDDHVINTDSHNRWVHRATQADYINSTHALSNGYVNFATVRNPYLRAESMWRDFCIKRPNLLPSYGNLSFAQFINKLILTDDSVNTNVHLRSQCYSIVRGNRVVVDHVVDIDNPHNLAAIIPDAPPLKRINTTFEDVVRPQWTDKLMAMVQGRYMNDFVLIGFDKETGKYGCQ